jgi:hypothetical protein
VRQSSTGAFAAQRFNPIAPARTATIYVNDVIKAVDRLGHRDTDAGANVVKENEDSWRT